MYKVYNQTIDIRVEEGIIDIKLPPGTTIDLDTAKEMVSKRQELFPDQKIAVLMDISNIKSVSKEARKYFTTEQSINNIIAGAFISDLVYHKILYNFFITFYKPKVPTRFFASKQEAFEWLKQITKG
jgi:hypothetical protein